MSTISRPMKFFARLMSDQGLTKKATLNAITVVLDYGAALVVGFVLTPLVVAGLGNYFYGMWQILNRLIGYITPVSGRPGYALKAKLANVQISSDYVQKRRDVSSTIIIWILFLPLLIIIGGTVSWFVPLWVHAPVAYFWIVRCVAALLVVNLIVDTLSSIPQAALQGENLGYKRMGMSVILVFFGGGLTWLALYFKMGIIGIASAAVSTTLVTGLFYAWVVRSYAPWFGVEKPYWADIRQMLGLSWWFMGWNLVTSLLLASDVVVLGLLNSVDSVANYTLTKYVPETLIGVIVIVIFGIMPGLGGIIGSGDYERAIRLRSEINAYIWLVATTLGTTSLIWNRVFINLWVGNEYYSGTLANLLMIIAAMQLAFIRSDGNIIDLTLKLSQKVILGFVAVLISIGAASMLVGFFHLGIAGLCLGIMSGRLVISVGYPVLISRFLNIPTARQSIAIMRPILVTVLFLGVATAWDKFAFITVNRDFSGWIFFVISAGFTGILIFLFLFFSGLSRLQRQVLVERVKKALVVPG